MDTVQGTIYTQWHFTFSGRPVISQEHRNSVSAQLQSVTTSFTNTVFENIADPNHKGTDFIRNKMQLQVRNYEVCVRGYSLLPWTMEKGH